MSNTLPTYTTAEALARSAENDRALREHFAARAAAARVTYCAGCAMRVHGAEPVACTPDGHVFHERCCP